MDNRASACEQLELKIYKLNSLWCVTPSPLYSSFELTKEFHGKIYEAHISSHMTQHRIIFNHSHEKKVELNGAHKNLFITFFL